MPLESRLPLSTTPRVVIVDADRRVQSSLADLLGVTHEVSVVGRAGDVRSALQVIESEHPDAVLVDPRLPDVEAGIALISGIARAWPDMRIVLTGWNDTGGHSLTPVAATRYVSKNASPEEFVQAVVQACCPDGC
ncbi:MAG TPA: response regulator transcription factor [Candidatus Limnocylindria bacterium]|jgi:DNA-binding NarL/FixJ family response regulator|nr:response regulator transcription factor [Candidatus Limnocylindria bacterium]